MAARGPGSTPCMNGLLHAPTPRPRGNARRIFVDEPGAGLYSPVQPRPPAEVSTMTRQLPPFPTTVVGSMPRPQYVKDLLAAGSRTGTSDEAWKRRMDDAVRYVIGMQEQAGIDVVSD